MLNTVAPVVLQGSCRGELLGGLPDKPVVAVRMGGSPTAILDLCRATLSAARCNLDTLL